MEKVRLFDPISESLNPLGRTIASEVYAALTPIFDKYKEQNVSMRELAYIVDSEVVVLSLSRVGKTNEH